ncbi:MAG: Isoprenylcysteine carboxyl methyltransferase family protein [Planctomycetaceae bacterium]|nr:Isoprenylcysteine carboxyl methyltransferase family protein [Planctomycetaceae bacterium]
MSSLLSPAASLATSQPAVPVLETLPAVTQQSFAGPTADKSIKSSFWYQWRSVITSISILSCWSLGLLSAPRILEGSLSAWLLNAAGWTCFTMGLAIRLWATLYIGGRKAKGVIDLGPYSVCRNPLYWGTFLVMLSQVLMFKSGIFAVGLILPILIYLLGVVPAEEAYLSQKLGAEYLGYCQRVPRWWPRFSLYSSPDVVDVNIRGLKAELVRILGWIWLPLVMQTLCALRMQPGWYAPLNLM